MSSTLISSKNTFWANAGGVLIAVVLIPLAFLLKLILWPFERPKKRTPDEVASYLRNFIDGTGDEWDWDDFVSIEIADPQLESIRDRARKFPDVGRGELQALLNEAEALASASG